ncbi:MAG: cation transporter [Pseudomonadales bacterium]
MSKECCENVNFDGNNVRYKRVLWVVIAINAAMFVAEITMSWLANSQALLADALDFLSDSATYSLSLLVIGHSVVSRARASLIKAASLALIAVWVLGSSLYFWFVGHAPSATPMLTTAFVALLANLTCLFLLLHYRDGDSNVRSVWLCTRNDAASNIAVMLTAVLVAYTGWHWPDLLVAILMAGLFLSTSWQIAMQAREELITCSS